MGEEEQVLRPEEFVFFESLEDLKVRKWEEGGKQFIEITMPLCKKTPEEKIVCVKEGYYAKYQVGVVGPVEFKLKHPEP